MSVKSGNVRFLNDRGLPTGLLNEVTVGLELSPAEASSDESTAGFMLAANILSRMFPRLRLIAPDVPLGPNAWGIRRLRDLPEALHGVSAGDVQWGGGGPLDIVLGFGGPPSHLATRQSFVSASGWTFSVDQFLMQRVPNVLASLAAACYGSAQVFLHAAARAGAQLSPVDPFACSLLNYCNNAHVDVRLPAEVDLGATHLVGVGAVGSAATYALGHLPRLRGSLYVIDNDHVERSNADRYVAVREADVQGRLPKVQLAVDALRHTGVSVIPNAQTFRQYRELDHVPIDLLLTPVDSEDGRRALARFLPRRVLNAATGGPTVTLSTHGFADGHGCLACLYPPPRDDRDWRLVMASHLGLSLDEVLSILSDNRPLTSDVLQRIEQYRGLAPGEYSVWLGKAIQSLYGREVCSAAGIPVPGGTLVAPLPFISALAGVLLATELVKERLEALHAYRLNNYFRLDLFHPPNQDFRRTTEPASLCICSDPDYVDAYRQRWIARPVVRSLDAAKGVR